MKYSIFKTNTFASMTFAQKIEYIETPGNILTLKNSVGQVISLGKIVQDDNFYHIQSKLNRSFLFKTIEELVESIDWDWMQENCIDVNRSF